MSYAINWLKSEPIEVGGDDRVYNLDEIKKSFEVREISPDGWLVLNDDSAEGGVKYSGWLKFAVLSFHSSGMLVENIGATLVFHGEGPSGHLREPRHTYWGDESSGYLFYPRAKIIVAGLEALKEFYDFT